jgi:hypothetical protein
MLEYLTTNHEITVSNSAPGGSAAIAQLQQEKSTLISKIARSKPTAFSNIKPRDWSTVVA